MKPLPRTQWIVLCCVFVLSLPAVTARLYSSDEIQYFSYLRSLWFDHDLSFQNEYQYFYDRGIARSEGFHETFLERETDAGRRINFGTLGCAILWAPFYAAGDAAARVTGAPVDGYSKPYVAGVAYGSAFYGFLAIVLGILCARRLGLDALFPAIAVWAGTPLLFYMYVAPPFSHACSAFAVALFVYTWLRVRGTWSARGALALGAAAALMAMVREQDAFFAVPAALDFLWAAVRPASDRGQSRIRSLQVALAGAVATAVCYLPQAIAYLRLNGHLGPHASVANKMNWRGPYALQVLFSPAHGFFVWTPLALIAIAGLVAMILPPPAGENHLLAEQRPAQPHGFRLQAEDRRRIGLCLLLMVALQVYIGGSVESWTVAGGYGQRRFTALTALLIVGLAAADADLRAISRAARRVFIAGCVVAAYWNLALIAEFAVGLMDRQHLEPRANAYHAFVTLPREAPSLMYRYVFDRSSFYKPRSEDREPRTEGR